MGGYIDERRRSSPTHASYAQRRQIPQAIRWALLAAMTVTGVFAVVGRKHPLQIVDLRQIVETMYG